MKEMTLLVEQATRRLVTQAILNEVSEDDLEVCIRQALGEELGNLASFDLGKEITVDWETRPDGVLIQVKAESQRKNYQLLSQILADAKKAVKNGEHCQEFLDRHRGIGHRMIASLSSECHYQEDGSLVMWFDKSRLPNLKTLHLVI